MNFYGSNPSPFVVENFNKKPPQWTPGQKITNKLPEESNTIWIRSKKNRQAYKMSLENPFLNDSYSGSNMNNVN